MSKSQYLENVADSVSLITRLFKIKNLILQRRFANKEEILEALGDGSGSISTLKRDLGRLRELGYDCALDRKVGFWRVSKSLYEGKSEDMEAILQLANRSIELAETLKEELDSKKNVSLEFATNKKELLAIFFNLIELSSKDQIVQFDYKPMKGDERKVTIFPQMVAERNNRLYVIGYRIDKQRHQVYSIDRIIDGKISSGLISIQSKVDFKLPIFSKEAWFEHIIGISNEEAEILDIELLFTPMQARYMREYKFHHKEEVLYDDEKGRCISVKLKNTYELRAKILELGPGVKVLKPESLKNQIKEILQEMINQYN